MPREVFIAMKVFTEICNFSAQYASNYLPKSKWVESMGYLFCRRDGNRYLVEDAVGISRGGETYVTMTPDQLARIEQLQQEHSSQFLGGWFHTHPGLSPFFSSTDIQNQMFYQAGNEDGLGIVFDHSMISPKFIGFKIFRLQDAQNPNTQYDDVDWKPLNWTAADLEQALRPIGVSNKIFEQLSYFMKLREKPPASELPPFQMPKVTDAGKMINICHNNALEALNQRDLVRALVTKRIEIALLESGKDIEMYVDMIIEFIEWALEGDKVLSTDEMIGRMEILEDEKKFPQDVLVYYTGKMNYFRGLYFQKLLQYSNAIEKYEKAIPFFLEEEYFLESAKTAMNIAECYDLQKEYKKAIEWLEKANEYIDKGIADAKECEDEDDLEYCTKIKPEIARFQTRVKAKLAAFSKGGTQRVV